MFDITSDSAIDLFKDKAEALRVKIIPLTYVMGGKMVEDYAQNEQEFVKFYDELSSGALPTTSQISPQSYYEFWEKNYEGKDFVHLSLSSGLSHTYESAKTAAREFEKAHEGAKVYVVDTLGATQAETPLLEKALELRDMGFGAKESADILTAEAHKITSYIIVDDLFHLKRGGRISAASAAIGSLMNVKPILVFNDEGRLCVFKKIVGWKKALKTAIEDMKLHIKGDKVWIASANAFEKAHEARDAVMQSFGIDAKIGWIGPVIGAHINSGTVGIVCMADEKPNMK